MFGFIPSAAIWTAGSRAFIQCVNFFTLILAARYLTPSDFGVFAMVSAIVFGLSQLAEAGWREAILAGDRGNDVKSLISTLAVSSGVLISLIGIAFSYLLPHFGIGEETSRVFFFLSVNVVLGSFCIVQLALLIQHEKLREVGLIQCLSEIAGLMTAIWAFSNGYGIFSLVATKYAVNLTFLLVALYVNRWMRFENPLQAKTLEILSFSLQILFARLIGFANSNIGLFAIGAFLGPTGAGLYRAGSRFAGSLTEVIAEPTRLLAWTLLKRTKQVAEANVTGWGGSHRDGRGDAATIVVAVYFIAVPAYIGVAIIAPNVVIMLLGKEWASAAPVLTALSLAYMLQIAAVITEPLLALRGHIRIVPRVSLFSACVMLVCLCSFAQFGLVAAAAGQVVAAMLIFPVTIWVQSRLGGIDWQIVAYRTWPILVAALTMAASVMAIDILASTAIELRLRTALDILVGIIVYISTLALLAPSFLGNFRILVRSAP